MTEARRRIVFASLVIAAASLASLAQATPILSAEPGPGRLRAGETVLVDDGSCPVGQIKQVVGGSDIRAATGEKRTGSGRTHRCVARP